jgi:hypothetical protein
MSLDANDRPKRKRIDSATWLQILEELNATEIDSWFERNFSYTFLRLGDRINVQPHYFLKAINLDTEEVRVIRIPLYIQSGREALNWATSSVLE